PRSPLFPYTTLFRSYERPERSLLRDSAHCAHEPTASALSGILGDLVDCAEVLSNALAKALRLRNNRNISYAQLCGHSSPHNKKRSEEHTSELQSREN